MQKQIGMMIAVTVVFCQAAKAQTISPFIREDAFTVAADTAYCMGIVWNAVDNSRQGDAATQHYSERRDRFYARLKSQTSSITFPQERAGDIAQRTRTGRDDHERNWVDASKALAVCAMRLMPLSDGKSQSMKQKEIATCLDGINPVYRKIHWCLAFAEP